MPAAGKDKKKNKPRIQPTSRFQLHGKPNEQTSSHQNHRHTQYSTKVSGITASVSRVQTQQPMMHDLDGPSMEWQSEVATDSLGQEEPHGANRLDDSAGIDLAYLDSVAEVTDDEGEENPVEKVRRVRQKGDEVLRQWIEHCDVFLRELNGLEGRGFWATDLCLTCGRGNGEFECISCGNREMICRECMLKGHVSLYLHRIRRWNGNFFEKTSLRNLGLRKQLGHPNGERCLNPEPCKNNEFWIIDSFGMHNVALDFCGCARHDQRHTIQLLRARLFPATVINPQSAATFDALKAFEMLSYESKVSAFEYYHTQSRLTDNTGLNIPNDRYLSFIRMTHEWRHLKMLMRSGRGHDPAGVSATKEGECAVVCPACPHPGINMELGWENAPPEQRFLHARFVALDANFRLKRKNVSSQVADPGLSHGWAYFVEETAFKEHIIAHRDDIEPKSTCSRHDAVNLSDTKPNRGHAASGIGWVVCSRHDMKLPNSVGDLQVGERYCNMDYLFYKSIVSSKLESYVISYDIACQWSIHLQQRMFELDHEFFLFDGTRYLRFLVPKFHLPAHIAPCRTRYSFNYTTGVGRTDGEAPERGWNDINPLAPSTREMGPGSRRDTLDYHFGDHNWRKTISMGKMLKRKIWSAAIDMAEHQIEHDDLSLTISPSILARWTAEVMDWENDPSKPNPFEETVNGPTQAAIRQQLADDEASDLQKGHDWALDDKVSPSVLIASGMDLEAEQRLLRTEEKKVWQHAQDRQKTTVQLRVNSLQRKIDAWTQYQALYCPAVLRLRLSSIDSTNSSIPLKSYDISLWLPSQIKGQVPVSEHLQRIELKLREAQAYEALEALRHQLQIRAYLYKFKDRFVRGQGANTRARNAISGVDSRIQAAAEEYRSAYSALLSLSSLLMECAWKDTLLPLMPGDIRDLSEGREGESEGRRTISWIWRTFPSVNFDTNDASYIQDRIRIEWAKSRARASRFTEEVQLLTHEMKRVLNFFYFQSKQWIKRGEIASNAEVSKPLAEGLQAFALRQATMYTGLGNHSVTIWKDIPGHVSRMRSIIQDPTLAEPGEFDDSTASKSKRTSGKKGR